jgi:hypothetical protein
MFGHCIDLMEELWRRGVGFTFDFFAEVGVNECSSAHIYKITNQNTSASRKVNL